VVEEGPPRTGAGFRNSEGGARGRGCWREERVVGRQVLGLCRFVLWRSEEP
jgi:hypothetical protein